MDLRRPFAEIVPCPPHRQGDVLAFLFRDAPAPLRDFLVGDALGGVPGRQEFLMAVRRERIIGAIRGRLVSPEVAIIQPPEVAFPPGRARLEAALVRGLLRRLEERGIRLVQGMAAGEPGGRGSKSLELGGLPFVTSLARWERRMTGPISLPAGIPQIRWDCWSPEAEPAFAEALEATYEGTLDIPELDGFRPYAIVRDCLREAGQFDPARWWLGRPGDAAGEVGRAAALIVLLGQEERDGSGLSLNYLGLTPSARGRGLGLRALADVAEFARSRGLSRLSLNVDLRNEPAIKLYRRAGFSETARAAVNLVRLDRDRQAGE